MIILYFPIKKATQLSFFDRMQLPTQTKLVHEKSGKTHIQGFHVQTGTPETKEKQSIGAIQEKKNPYRLLSESELIDMAKLHEVEAIKENPNAFDYIMRHHLDREYRVNGLLKAQHEAIENIKKYSMRLNPKSEKISIPEVFNHKYESDKPAVIINGFEVFKLKKGKFDNENYVIGDFVGVTPEIALSNYLFNKIWGKEKDVKDNLIEMLRSGNYTEADVKKAMRFNSTVTTFGYAVQMIRQMGVKNPKVAESIVASAFSYRSRNGSELFDIIKATEIARKEGLLPVRQTNIKSIHEENYQEIKMPDGWEKMNEVTLSAYGYQWKMVRADVDMQDSVKKYYRNTWRYEHDFAFGNTPKEALEMTIFDENKKLQEADKKNHNDIIKKIERDSMKEYKKQRASQFDINMWD